MNKILIVDDEKHIRKVLENMWSFEGYKVEEATVDGLEAIDKWNI